MDDEKFWRDDFSRYCLFRTDLNQYVVIDLSGGGPVLIENDDLFRCMVQELLDARVRIITDPNELVQIAEAVSAKET